MKRIVVTFCMCVCVPVLGLHMEHKHFVTQSLPGAPDEINMFCERRADVGHTQTAAITCLLKTLEYSGGQRMPVQTKPWSLYHCSDKGGRYRFPVTRFV